jgi:hypothetical protein
VRPKVSCWLLSLSLSLVAFCCPLPGPLFYIPLVASQPAL